MYCPNFETLRSIRLLSRATCVVTLKQNFPRHEWTRAGRLFHVSFRERARRYQQVCPEECRRIIDAYLR